MGHCGRRAARCLRAGQVPRRHPAHDGHSPPRRSSGTDQGRGSPHEGPVGRRRHNEPGPGAAPSLRRSLLQHVALPTPRPCFASRGRQQQLRADFEAYLDGFSPNIQEVLDKFKFRNQIPTLVEAAWSASRTKDTCLSAQHRRITPRRGQRRAVVAVAHTIIVAIYHMLSNGTRYRDLGGNYFSRRAHHFHLDRAVHQIESLGYRVSL